MTIGAIVKARNAEIFALRPDQNIADAVSLFATHRIGAAPVLKGEEVAGIFSERDVIRCVQEHGTAALGLSISEVMTTPALTVTPDEQVLGALSLMTHRRVRHLPVVAEGRLVGFVSIGDLVKFRIDQVEADAAAMRAYIQQA
ncbi:CBS domain-containing protein [Sphingomonas aerophila]|uniref:CBS domain-containing protein n=1 Tax=Sphingomonas aerophila TaxID=1344948 RepID=A0A7W9BDP5_9SPHN|nr:CBS domain-containing protein [Sphingomonas aerophila]MBB5715093.1 CBS domain-containing protein [Sphingomonas aerophila]